MRRVLLAFTTLAITLAAGLAAPAADDPKPIKVLIITGDHGHDWKATTPALQDILSAQGRIRPEVTTTPAKDLTDENLAKYDVLLLNYKDTPKGAPETKWSDANKEAFLKAVKGGKGLVVYPPRLERLHQAQLGGVREGHRRRLAVAGLPRPEARVRRQEDRREAPDLRGAPRAVRPRDRRAVSEFADGPRQRRAGDRLFRPEQAQGDGQGRAGDLGEPVRQGAGLQQRPRPRHHGPGRPAVARLAEARGRVGRDRQGGGRGEIGGRLRRGFAAPHGLGRACAGPR